MNDCLKTMALLAAIPLLFPSCKEDKNEPDAPKPIININNVFPNGTPTSIGDLKFSYDKNGQLIKISDSDITATYEYGAFTRALPTAQVKMTVTDQSDPEDSFVAYFYLNKKGYAEYAEICEGDEVIEYSFDYNSASQLEIIKLFADKETTIYHLYYNEGDVFSAYPMNIHVNYFVKTEYTNSEISTPIENKGGIMFFNMFFGIDMEFLDLAYYAGIMGQPTKHLPVSSSYYPDLLGVPVESFMTMSYNWKLNSNGLPVSLHFAIDNEEDPEENEEENISFSWK